MTRRGGADYLSIVEDCYELQADHATWAHRIVESATAALDLGSGIGMNLYREREDGQGAKMLAVQTSGNMHPMRLGTPFIEGMRGEAYRQYFYPRQPVTLASPIVAKLPLHLQFAFRVVNSVMGTRDFLGMLGYPTPGWILALAVGVRADCEVSPSLRAVLHRLRIHMESGMRLRILGPEQPVAVLSPEGQVLHLEGELARQAAPECLVQQAKTISRVRLRSERTKDEALAVWTALVEGRWSVIERVDTDGKRLYFAYENSPQARAYRALTPSEATVLDQSVQGLPGKYVAYSTGLRSSRISEQLLSAATKLGFRSRHELLRVAAALRGTGRYQLLAGDLTPTEQEILRLVKLGMSNREIAQERRTSIKTIANQVSSVLRKAQVGGRRALLGVEADARDSEAGRD